MNPVRCPDIVVHCSEIIRGLAEPHPESLTEAGPRRDELSELVSVPNRPWRDDHHREHGRDQGGEKSPPYAPLEANKRKDRGEHDEKRPEVEADPDEQAESHESPRAAPSLARP